MSDTPTTDFAALAAKTPSVMQKGLAAFIAETTGKKVSAATVATVMRFSGPYRSTEHYTATKEAWKGSKTEYAQAKAVAKAAAERKRVAEKREKLQAELTRLAEIEAALGLPTGVVQVGKDKVKAEAAPKAPAKPRKSRAAKAAEKAEADKARLTVVPPLDEDDEDEQEPAPEIVAVESADEFVEDEDDTEDFGVAAAPATTLAISFEGIADDDDDEDDDDDF